MLSKIHRKHISPKFSRNIVSFYSVIVKRHFIKKMNIYTNLFKKPATAGNDGQRPQEIRTPTFLVG